MVKVPSPSPPQLAKPNQTTLITTPYYPSNTLSAAMAKVLPSLLECSNLLVCLFIFLLPEPPISQAQAPDERRPCKSVSAIFVFGDSTVDSGNNNYLATAFKSNFPPYGRDFTDHLPTGRFTNGKLTTDFIASYLGLKDEVPPYLDGSLSTTELMTGVSFASAGSGFDLLTAQMTGVIPVLEQVNYFREYLTRLEFKIGKKRTEELVREAIFVVSAGTNDFVFNYFTLPFRQHAFSLQAYQHLLLQGAREFLQGLHDLGARRIVVVGLPPMGCLPIVITLNWRGGYQERGCFEFYNAVAKDYNTKLQELITSFATKSGANKIVYADIYEPLMNLILDPSKFGFEETVNGCCGTGLIEAAFLCNLKSIICRDASKYVFWDSVHPTERTYFIIFKTLRPQIKLVC